MERVLIGMSGGVDSSVAAALLKEQGYEVIGATLKLWDNPTGEHRDAASVCALLGIEHHVLDFSDAFLKQVIDPFVSRYQEGKTPNPCIFCNRYIKFSALFEAAKTLNCTYIATGHYAQMATVNGRKTFLREEHNPKDQTYVLYPLTQELLSRLLLPLSGLDKEQVRALARKFDLPIAEKADSQEICFIPDHDYGKFLREYTKTTPTPGNFIDREGRVLGQHTGIWDYTVGQRKGLGIALGTPVYVTHINPADNTVTLGVSGQEYHRSLIATDLNWMAIEALTEPQELEVKIRYGGKPQPATVTPLADGSVRVDFAEPLRAVTPGQAVVFYKDNLLIGGGEILSGELL